MKRIGGIIALTGLGGIAMALAMLFTLDLKPWLPDINAQMSERTGHRVDARGALGLDLDEEGLWFVLNDLSLNTPGSVALGARPIGGTIGQLRCQISLTDLAQGIFRFEELRIIRGDLTVLANRSPVQGGSLTSEPIVLGNREVQFGGLNTASAFDTHLTVISEGATLVDLTVAAAEARPGEIGLDVSAKGFVREQPVSFEGRTGPLMAALSGHKIFLDGAFQSASARLSVNGTVGDIETLGVNLEAEGDAPELNDVALLLGFKNLAQNTPTTVTASIQGTRKHLVLEDIQAGFGRGDISGRLEIIQGDFLEVRGKLNSELLDLDAFEGVRWTRPPTRIFSNDPLPTDWLRSGRVDLSYDADNIILADTLLSDGHVRAFMSNGVLSINPIEAHFLDGAFDSLLVVDARAAPFFKSETNLKNFDIGRFLSEVSVMGSFEAVLDFGMVIEGEGESVAGMLADAKGQTNFLMGPGILSERAAEMAGSDLRNALQPMVIDDNLPSEEDGQVNLTCAVSRFDIEKGVAKSRAFLVQTENTITTGRGEINLGTESLNLVLAPRPKNPRLLEHAADLQVGGSFISPIFNVQRDKLSRGIAGSLGRFAMLEYDEQSLLPLLEGRQSEFNDCIRAFVTVSGKPKNTVEIIDDYSGLEDFDFRRASKGK